ncbi:DUF4345 domain-containing protein [Afipia felis]|jgi:hypothetical protein|uniref:DUF4345 domain-containing protein n=2 Tax=Afipia felis TaxID=1035 RepID=A0A380W506_AFIFE|nr:DUF4345 domain-containing protein [Afipia felis]EKS31191.1 hypothetical protein HMPREF9697_03719 [Afipia felis ATCC 53690]SUU75935.1 Uncharacterised protein [Afipia felis]SUU84002.1 Uncharacterised protein [Afipia felis]
MERIILQIAIGVVAIVLIGAGTAGAMLGVDLIHGRNGGLVDSYFRYLSAMTAAMGLMFAMTIPHVETHRERIGTLSFLIFIGGLAHLYTFSIRPTPTVGTLFMLFMELIFVPLLWLGQRHIAHKAASPS